MKNYITEAREAVSQYNVVGGISLVDLQDILAVLVGAKSTPELTGRLAAKGIQGLVDMSLPELESAGLSKLQAQRVHAGCLMAQSLKKVGRKEKRYTIRSPKDAANYMMDEMSTLLQEHFVVLYLNIKNEIISKQTIFVGSLNSSIVHPREIMREAVKLSSASFICLHNHPSGNPAPSPEDIAVTKRLQEVGSICGVELLDHVIIGDQTFISLNEKGYMQ